jgi:hypothetical protein
VPTLQIMPRPVPLLLATTALMVGGTPSVALERGVPAAAKIVVRAKFERYSPSTKTITYSSRKGTYSATWIGVRRYRLSGTITGLELRGTIRTLQRASGTHYRARGSGRLGGRRVTISGGGPNNLRTARLVLR